LQSKDSSRGIRRIEIIDESPEAFLFVVLDVDHAKSAEFIHEIPSKVKENSSVNAKRDRYSQRFRCGMIEKSDKLLASCPDV